MSPRCPVPLPRRGRPAPAGTPLRRSSTSSTPTASRPRSRLVERADVLIEGYRPGVAERLGLGPDDCLARNPRLVYGRMTGWGQDGPLAAARRATTSTTSPSPARSHAIGRAGGTARCRRSTSSATSAAARCYLVVGVLAALLEARTSGRGQVVDAAIVDGTAHLLRDDPTACSRPAAGRTGAAPTCSTPARPSTTSTRRADGGCIAVGALEPQFYAELLAPARPHRTPLADRLDPPPWPALRERCSPTASAPGPATSGPPSSTAPTRASRPCSASPRRPRHPHLAARGTYVEHHGVVQPAPAPRFSRTRAALGAPPSTPGADTRSALRAWGIDDVDALIATGAAIQP